MIFINNNFIERSDQKQNKKHSMKHKIKVDHVVNLVNKKNHNDENIRNIYTEEGHEFDEGLKENMLDDLIDGMQFNCNYYRGY